MGISNTEQVKGAGPGVHRVTDTKGLYLKVNEGGDAGSWFFRYRLAGRRREFGLGSRGVVTLGKARVAAQEAAALVRKGIDPVDDRKRERAENLAKTKAQPEPTFKQMAETFLKIHGGDWKGRYARTMWRRLFEIHIFPTIGDLTLKEIKIPHITAIMQRAKHAGAPMTAHRARMRTEQVLNHAIALSGKAIANPASGKLHPKPPKVERPHFKAVELDDAPAVFRELKAQAAAHEGSLTGTALNAWLLTILTAARPSEALGTRWSEIDLAKGLWVRPPGRMKSGRPHTVPLSPAALEVLEAQARVCTGDMVFPGRSGGLMAYDTFTSSPAKVGVDAANPHGWRSVFRDWAGEYGDVECDLAEFALAHSLGKVEAAYRKRSAVEKRRGVMAKYSEWLGEVGAAKAVAFRDKPAQRKRDLYEVSSS
jgi:integrase